MKENKLYQKVAQEMIQEIHNGVYGRSGERFLTVKELMKEKQVCTETAQKIVHELKTQKYISLIGKKYYLSHDLLEINTPFYKQLNRKKIIGFHVTNFSSIISDPLIKHITLMAKEKGYEIITACSFYDEKREKSIIKMFMQLNVSGVFSAPWMSDVPSVYHNFYLPIVYFGNRPKNVESDCVYFTNVKLSENIAEHFISKGYRHFAYIGVDVWLNDPRLDGFRNKLEQEHYHIPDQNILFVKENEIYEIVNKVRILLMHQTEPIAIFCINDYLALNIIQICNQFGYKVPEQVAVAGCGNSSSSNYSTPTITSVDFNVRKMAGKGIELLMNQINTGKKSNISYEVETLLYVRESTSRKENKT